MDCSVCLDTMDEKSQNVSTVCGHVFHKKCVENWMNTGQNSCPQCRKPIRRKKIRRIFTQPSTALQKRASDAEKKSQKLTEENTDLHKLLRKAEERYGSLEDHFEQEKVNHKEEVKRCNDTIGILCKELTDAKHLIKTTSVARLSDLSAIIAQLEGDLGHNNETLRQAHDTAFIARRDLMKELEADFGLKLLFE